MKKLMIIFCTIFFAHDAVRPKLSDLGQYKYISQNELEQREKQLRRKMQLHATMLLLPEFVRLKKSENLKSVMASKKIAEKMGTLDDLAEIIISSLIQLHTSDTTINRYLQEKAILLDVYSLRKVCKRD